MSSSKKIYPHVSSQQTPICILPLGDMFNPNVSNHNIRFISRPGCPGCNQSVLTGMSEHQKKGGCLYGDWTPQ